MEATFEQIPEEGERASHVNIWGKMFWAGGTASSKALRRNCAHPSVSREGGRWSRSRMSSEENRVRWRGAFWVIIRTVTLTLSDLGDTGACEQRSDMS